MSIQKNVKRDNGKIALLITAVCLICLGLFATAGLQAVADEGIGPQTESTVPVYRLYNDVTSEHLYTTNKDEASSLASNYNKLNWKYEGVGWLAPSTGTAVHRLYNPRLGNHLYTSNQAEIANLVANWDWNDEGVLFYSGGNVSIYRLYNPFLHSLHLWTTNDSEYNSLPAHQWQQEDVAFKAVALGSAATEEDEHIHIWKVTSNTTIHNGYACNGCGVELTDNIQEHTKAHALAGEPSGWHTHTWFLVPVTETCTTCGAKGHEHDWQWIEPEYSYGTDEIQHVGYYKCWLCGNTSDDGNTIADYYYRLDPEYGRADAHDTWTTGVDFSGTDYVVWTKSTQTKGDPMKLQRIDLDGTESLAIGESKTLPVIFTPASTTSDRTITWTSDNPSVATVNQGGTVTAHAEGVAKITAKNISGKQDTSVVRVTAGNVGNVRSMKLIVNGADASQGAINLAYHQSCPVTLVTNPSSAVYEVSYSTEGGSSLSIDGYGSRGDLSIYSWEHGISYTDPSSSIFGSKRGTSILKATVKDVNGKVLEARATVNVV